MTPSNLIDFFAASLYHLNYEYQLNANTTVSLNVTDDDLLYGSLTRPFEAGKTAAFVFEKTFFNMTKTQYVLYVRAEDEAGNIADRSNGARWCNECYEPEPTTTPKPTTTTPKPTTMTSTMTTSTISKANTLEFSMLLTILLAAVLAKIA